MNQLQRFAANEDVFVTLGPVAERIDPQRVVTTVDYHHPAFSCEAVHAQKSTVDFWR